MVEINIEELVEACNLTWDQAKELIGKTSTQGNIIGITTKPSLGKAEGIYLTCNVPNQQATQHKVG